MNHQVPSKILITGGREIGGVGSFAEGLRSGFTELSIPVEIVPPSQVFSRTRELRDSRILKILSTGATFAAPFARRTICMAHGIPCAGYQGWRRFAALITAFRLANSCPGVQLVSVSHYTAITLRAMFNVQSDAVVHNPVKAIYLEPAPESCDRNYITYAGRLVAEKNLHRMIPAIRDLLDEFSDLRVCIIGAGNQRAKLEEMTNRDPRFEFKGNPDDKSLREWLRRTKVFVSGNQMEGFGISYLEAMTQGCIVAMPGSGGGIEIALDKVGRSVQLFPLSWNRSEVLETLRRAMHAQWEPVDITPFTTKAAASFYLQVDSKFSLDGRFSR